MFIGKTKNYSAFTIIEVVLVLAIAGLIFLMVFIALPALQRNQRNTQYRQNVAMGVDMMRRYQANNRGRLPTFTGDENFVVGNTTDSRLFNDYVQNSGLADDTLVKIQPGFTRLGPVTNNRFGRVFISPGVACAQPSIEFAVGQVITVAKPGSAVVWTVLEEGENGLVYCQDV